MLVFFSEVCSPRLNNREGTSRPILSYFLHFLITIFAARELLYSDPGLMEGIEGWITAMSSLRLTQFRHTFTIVELEFVNSFAHFAAQATKSKPIAQQIDNMRPKRKSLAAMWAGSARSIKN